MEAGSTWRQRHPHGAAKREERAVELASRTADAQSETTAIASPLQTKVVAIAIATLSAAAAEDCIDVGTSPVTDK
jgi:hypothetical protein